MKFTASTIIGIIVTLIGIAILGTQVFGKIGSYAASGVIFLLGRAISFYQWFD